MTQYDTGPGCKVCDARVLWREGMGWLHAADPVTCVPLFLNEDPADHTAQGDWQLGISDDRVSLPLHRTEANYGVRCSTCDGNGCPDCTDPA